jgi:S1-C subfamily serine protease
VAGLVLPRWGYLLGVGAIAAPALCIVASPASSATSVARACANDVKSFCAGVMPGGITACVNEHFKDLSADCQVAIIRVVDVGRTCKADVEQFCSNVTKGAFAECIKVHASEISGACREAIARAEGIPLSPPRRNIGRSFSPSIAQNKSATSPSVGGFGSSPPVASPTQPPTPGSESPNSGPKEVSSGTGFYITDDGSILTNAHVIKDCSEIKVEIKPGTFVTATASARDATNDLALLKVNARPDEVAALRLTPHLGEPVEAYGYPLAEILSTSGNFSLGNISALSGLGDDSRYLQISVPVQPGNSGGPLLDQHGNVIGIVSAKLNALKVMRLTEGDIPQNVNFAVRASVAANFLQTNDIKFAIGESTQVMESPDLAERAKAMSVFVICK